MYDDTCRFLAENFSADFASWLLGESITLTELKPSELSLEPIRADALILLESDDSVLHLEFQTHPKRDIPFRMLDYRVRVYRRYPDKRMRQVVVYLQPTRSDRVRQTSFSLERTRHEFDVVCLWEQPAAFFLEYPGLLPFATLGQTTDPEATLRQVAQTINQISDPITQANLTAASAILAGIKLEDEVVYRILRRDIMQESTVYRSILAEGEARKQREIAVNLLRQGITINIIASATGLSIEEVQQLQQQITKS
ncbi:Rpn family recombination-promoting nuclease/putative transposase, partial [Nostoc sp. CHAB 5715]|uniref:Rpn family recombination-promoting nuclease/putative transposase n=1 Tax=Nostoc sp. CHAB 5715 TaxID=2780400 RepID=UPI001E563959